MIKYEKNNIEQSKDKLIEKLSKEVQELKEQVSLLQNELEFEKNKPKDGYETTKKLIVELEQKKQEYESLSTNVRMIRDSYNQKLEEIEKVKTAYSNELNNLMKDVKYGLKGNKNKKFFGVKNTDELL